ncbi:MAG: glutaredoxin [Parasphingorhabdus sp.]|jgi:glutaredoxin
MLLKLLPGNSFIAVVLFLTLQFGQSSITFGQTEVFKVTDSKGNISYQSVEPPEGTIYVRQLVETQEKTEEVIVEEAITRVRVLKAEGLFPLALFSTPEDSKMVCDACDYVRFFLNKHQLPFEELDVENDFYSQDRLKDLTDEYRVPVLLIGEKPVTGYSRDTLEVELSAAGYLEITKADNAEFELDEDLTEENNGGDLPDVSIEDDLSDSPGNDSIVE